MHSGIGENSNARTSPSKSDKVFKNENSNQQRSSEGAIVTSSDGTYAAGATSVPWLAAGKTDPKLYSNSETSTLKSIGTSDALSSTSSAGPNSSQSEPFWQPSSPTLSSTQISSMTNATTKSSTLQVECKASVNYPHF